MKSSTNSRALEVTIVVIVQNQGRVVHKTLKSVARSIEKAAPLKCEVLIVGLDVDRSTKDYLDNFPAKIISAPNKVRYHKGGDAGAARNSAVQSSKAEYLCFIEAGDLMSGNFLSESIKLLKSTAKQTVVHPQFSFLFGSRDGLKEITSSTSASFQTETMIEADCFTTLAIGAKSIFVGYPYQNKQPISWAWNNDTLAGGVIHRVAEKTLLASSAAEEIGVSLLPPSALFQPLGRIHQFKQMETERVVIDYKDRTLNLARKLTEKTYQSPMAKLIKRSHPRLDTYLTSLLNETRHLFRPLDRPREIMPEWLVTELYKLHNIDLAIYPTGYLRHHVPVVSAQPSNYSRAYWELCEKLTANTDILFLVPYMKNGGAERELINQIKAALKFNPKLSIKVLATENSTSTFTSNLPKEVGFIEAGPEFYSLTIDLQARLIATLITQLAPRKVHVVNSVASYFALRDYAADIHLKTKIFITIFMIDKTDEGRKTHKFTECMLSAIDFVETVFTDNQAVVDQLSDLMGIDKTKFTVLYQPADLKHLKAAADFQEKPTKILWAGRMDRQKRPDILITIARKAAEKKMNIEFHVYGSSALNDVDYLETIRNTPLIKYHGPFEAGLPSLPLDRFDIFLMTSEWEGFPNVLLEAIVGGLLPVAPDVGGISELINDGSTGYLVEGFANVEGYLEAIKKGASDGHRSREMIKRAQALVKQRHKEAAYEERIRQSRAYYE